MSEKQHDKPDKTITEESVEEKLWLDITTLNILPGEEVIINLEDKNESNDEKISLSATVDNKGKAMVMLNSKAKVIDTPTSQNNYDTTPPKVTGQFKKGWWSIDLLGESPITRALPGMHVYFHIETTIPDGESVHIELYEDDNTEKEETGNGDKDEHQPLISKATKKPSTHETVRNGKIIKSIILDNFESAIDKDVDKQIELYFRCSHNGENIELPKNPKDYLVVGTLVIDRYKMPGLNGEGTDIADDLTYGTGVPKGELIYNADQVQKYKEEYEENGLDETKHSLFTNKENLPAIPPNITAPVTEVKTKPKNDRMSLIIEETTKIDHTYVSTPRPEEIYRSATLAANEATKNLKAKYSIKEIEELGYLMDYITAEVPERSLWKDFKIMEESMVWGELNEVLDQMIAKFKSNTGGIFENLALTNSIKNNPNTQKYCKYVENYIAEKIKQKTLQDITCVEDKEADFGINPKVLNDKRRDKGKIKGDSIIDNGKKIPFTRPSFSYKNSNNLLEGRTLALNDIWATEIILKELKNNGDNYTVKYQVTLWDNFGLDKPDMQKFFYYGAGFRAWFVLQHLYGYKPFVTKITFEKEFKGNISQGREERLANQKSNEATKQKEIDNIKFKTRRRGWEY